MPLEIIKGSDLDSKLTDELTIVNVFATWCGPCKMMMPVFEQLSGKINVYKIDVDENKEFASKMNIKSVPTTLIYKRKKIVDSIIGFAPYESILKRLHSFE